MEATVMKTESLSPLPDDDDDEVKPVISYASGNLDVVDKWLARLLFTHDDDDADDWAKRLERQIAVHRVVLPFLAEDQIRGKAWRRCGLYSRLGAMPRSGLSSQVHRKIKKLQNQNLVRQRLKSELIKMERNNDLGKCLDNFTSPSSNSHFLNRSPFRNLKHLDISQESGITVLSMSSKQTPRCKRKIAKTWVDKSESNHAGSPIKLKNDNCIIPESLTSSETSSLFSLSLLDKKHACPSLLTNLNLSVEISQIPSTLPCYSRKIPSSYCNDMENMRENTSSHNFINDSLDQVKNADSDNKCNNNTLKIINSNSKNQSLQSQLYTSITQKSYINQENDFLSYNNAHRSLCTKQDQRTTGLQNNNLKISNTEDITLSGLDNPTNSQFDHNLSSKINNTVDNSKKKKTSIEQKFSSTQQDIMVSHHDQFTILINNNEVGNSSSNSCLTYIRHNYNVNDKETLIEDNVDKQNFNSLQVSSLKCLYGTSSLLDTDYNTTIKNGNKDDQIILSNTTYKSLPTLFENSSEKMTLKNPNLVKQSYKKVIYINVATHGSASQTSAINLQNPNSSIDSNNQLINNSQCSLTFSSTQDSAAGPENFPPDTLLSNYSCEYDIAYTKKDLKPNVYDNYYTKKIKTTLLHTLQDIIPTEQSLTQFFEASKKSFRKTKVEVCEKVKDILFELEQDEFKQNSK